MTRRFLGSIGMALLIAVFSTATPRSQSVFTKVGPVSPGQAAKGYVPPKTEDGHPDLSGFWTNATYTPLERPGNVTKAIYTLDEVVAREKGTYSTEFAQGKPGTEDDNHYESTQFGLTKQQGRYVRDLRTSLINDPPDGRVPPFNDQGQRRFDQREAERKGKGIYITPRAQVNAQPGMGRYDSAQSNGLDDRCIITGQAVPPMVPKGYNNNYQIVQSPGWVAIMTENMHATRLIPTDGRPGVPQHLRSWIGISRGRWEGNTLVVESSNLTTKLSTPGGALDPFWMAVSDQMKVTERFTRVDAQTISYKFTVEDPATWTRPWSAEVFYIATEGPIFEHACHEGNRGLTNSLKAARMAEEAAAAKKGSN